MKVNKSMITRAMKSYGGRCFCDQMRRYCDPNMSATCFFLGSVRICGEHKKLAELSFVEKFASAKNIFRKAMRSVGERAWRGENSQEGKRSGG